MKKNEIKAKEYIEKIYKNKKRKDKTTTLVEHSLNVYNILKKVNIVDENLLTSAILHDIFEESNIKYQDIYFEFGKEIADIIENCSDDKDKDNKTCKQIQIQSAKHKKISTKIIKTAEKIDNFETLLKYTPNWTKEELEGYIVWSDKIVKKYNCLNKELMKEYQEISKKVKEKNQIKKINKENIKMIL